MTSRMAELPNATARVFRSQPGAALSVCSNSITSPSPDATGTREKEWTSAVGARLFLFVQCATGAPERMALGSTWANIHVGVPTR